MDKGLRALGFSAPYIYGEDLDAGLLLIEDLGDDTLARVLEKGGDELALYIRAAQQLGAVRAQAVFSGSKLSGYRIYPGGRASIGAFTRLGLRPGDLITAVNGTPLDDPNRGSEILDTLSSSASASVTVQRNGQSVDLNLNLETVASDAENLSAMPARNGAAILCLSCAS